MHASSSPGSSHEHNELAHVMPAKVLLAVFAALMVGTVLTVLAVKIDLGSQTNFLIAMAIAVVKASLVCAYFMHLRYDNKFNLLLFVGGLVFMAVFISFAVLDTDQTRADIRARTEAAAQVK